MTIKALQDALYDGPVRITADGSIISIPTMMVPECIDPDGTISSTAGMPWVAMDGYSRQNGYRGPVMHSSEYVGGAMAYDILSTPGVYALVDVYSDCDEPCSEDCEGPELEGWLIATIAENF